MEQILYVECVLLAARDKAEQASSRLRVVKTRTGQLVDIRFENNVRGLCSMLPVRPKREKARPSQTKKSYFTTIRLTFTTIPLRSDKSLCCQRLKLKIVCTLCVRGECLSVGRHWQNQTGKIKLAKSLVFRAIFCRFRGSLRATSRPHPLTFIPPPLPQPFQPSTTPASSQLNPPLSFHQSTLEHQKT